MTKMTVETDTPRCRQCSIALIQSRMGGVQNSRICSIVSETCIPSPLQNLPTQNYLMDWSLSLPIPRGEVIEMSSVDLSMQSIGHSQEILENLRRLDRLDARSLGLSEATKFAYWGLGMTYERFCEVSRNDMHPRTEQSHYLDLFCEESCFQSIVLDTNAQSRLRKRLQRGRKYILFVTVLHAAPVVCVSRMDGVKLEDLRGMCTFHRLILVWNGSR